MHPSFGSAYSTLTRFFKERMAVEANQAQTKQKAKPANPLGFLSALQQAPAKGPQLGLHEVSRVPCGSLEISFLLGTAQILEDYAEQVFGRIC